MFAHALPPTPQPAAAGAGHTSPGAAQPSPQNDLHAVMVEVEHARDILGTLVQELGRAATALEAAEVKSAGALVIGAWANFDRLVDRAGAASKDIMSGAAPDELAGRFAALKDFQRMPQIVTQARHKLARVGPGAAAGISSHTAALPDDVAGFVNARVAHTLDLIAKVRQAAADPDRLDAVLATTENSEDFDFIRLAVTKQGVDAETNQGYLAEAHGEVLEEEDTMMALAGQELPRGRLAELREIASDVRDAKDAGVLGPYRAKELIGQVSGPEREALIAAIDTSSPDGVNWLLGAEDEELRGMVNGTRWGQNMTYDAHYEEQLAKSRRTVLGALTDGEFYENAAELAPGRILQAGVGFVKAAGDIPIIGGALSKVTDPLAELGQKGVGALDSATGADEIWKRTPEAKAWSDGLANGSGGLLLNAATGKAAAEIAAVGDAGLIGFGGEAIQVGSTAVDFLEGLDKLNDAFGKARGLVDLVGNVLVRLPAALIEAESEDQSVAVAVLSEILDSAIGAAANVAGEKLSPGAQAAAGQAQSERNLRELSYLRARDPSLRPEPADTQKERWADAGYHDEGPRRTVLPGAPEDKVDVSSWAGLADLLLVQMAKAVKEGLIAVKNALLAPLAGGAEPLDTRRAALKGAAGAAVNVLGNVVEAAGDKLGELGAHALTEHLIAPWLARKGVPVPPPVYEPSIAHVLKIGAVELFGVFKGRIQDALLGAFGVPELRSDAPKTPEAHEPAADAQAPSYFDMFVHTP